MKPEIQRTSFFGGVNPTSHGVRRYQCLECQRVTVVLSKRLCRPRHRFVISANQIIGRCHSVCGYERSRVQRTQAEGPRGVINRIIEAAKRMDLVVMSTTGRSGLAHLLIGSVAEKVVRHSPIPVLTMRPEAARKAART